MQKFIGNYRISCTARWVPQTDRDLVTDGAHASLLVRPVLAVPVPVAAPGRRDAAPPARPALVVVLVTRVALTVLLVRPVPAVVVSVTDEAPRYAPPVGTALLVGRTVRLPL